MEFINWPGRTGFGFFIWVYPQLWGSYYFTDHYYQGPHVSADAKTDDLYEGNTKDSTPHAGNTKKI